MMYYLRVENERVPLRPLLPATAYVEDLSAPLLCILAGTAETIRQFAETMLSFDRCSAGSHAAQDQASDHFENVAACPNLVPSGARSSQTMPSSIQKCVPDLRTRSPL